MRFALWRAAKIAATIVMSYRIVSKRVKSGVAMITPKSGETPQALEKRRQSRGIQT